MTNGVIFSMVLIIFCASVVIFFSQELGSMYQKMVAIPGFELIFFLSFMSFVVERYENWVLWFLGWLQTVLYHVTHYLAQGMPFKWGAVSLMQMVCLSLVPILPALFLSLWVAYKRRRKHYVHFDVKMDWFGLWLWTLMAFLVVTG